MTNDKEHYSDILDEQNDAALLHHAHNIETLYTAPQLPAQLTWTRLQLQARPVDTKSNTQRRLTQSWRHPAQRASVRFSLAAVALVVVLLLSGFAFAFSGGDIDALLQKVLLAGNGGQQVFQKQEFTAIRKAQTIEGFTLTVEQAYADANRIIVSYSIKTPDISSRFGKGGWWAFGDVTLATKGGNAISEILSRGTLPNWAAASPADRNTGLNVVYFDGSKIQGNSKSIDLHTTIQYVCGTQAGGPISETVNGTTIALTPTPDSNCSPKAVEVSKKLNWIFDFSVPFHAGRVIPVNQSITSSNTTIMLRRVVITPSETRFYIEGLAYGDELYTLQYTLALGKKTYNHADISGQSTPDKPFIMLDESLAGMHGNATFTIQPYPVPANRTPDPRDLPRVSGGPWVFHFIM